MRKKDQNRSRLFTFIQVEVIPQWTLFPAGSPQHFVPECLLSHWEKHGLGLHTLPHAGVLLPSGGRCKSLYCAGVQVVDITGNSYFSLSAVAQDMTCNAAIHKWIQMFLPLIVDHTFSKTLWKWNNETSIKQTLKHFIIWHSSITCILQIVLSRNGWRMNYIITSKSTGINYDKAHTCGTKNQEYVWEVSHLKIYCNVFFVFDSGSTAGRRAVGVSQLVFLILAFRLRKTGSHSTMSSLNMDLKCCNLYY